MDEQNFNNNEEQNPNNEKKKNELKTGTVLDDLNKERRITVIALIVFAIVIIIFGTFNLKAKLKTPFNYQVTSTNQQNGICTGANCPSNNNSTANADTKNKDTDQDGLSDYDEINIYGTSPYLEDSDSDGTTDKKAVDQGICPNCPSTKATTKVNTSDQVVSDAQSDTINSIQKNSSLNQLDKAAQEIQTQSSGSGLLSSDPTEIVKTLRAMLIQKGMNKEILDKISDEDLLLGYKDALVSATASQGENSSQKTNNTSN
jgi:hypothetical protein